MAEASTDSVHWVNVDPSLENDLRAALDRVSDPCSIAHGVPLGLVEMGLVKKVERLQDGELAVELRLTSPFCEMVGYFSRELEKECLKVPSISGVGVTFDRGFDWTEDAMTAEARARQRRLLPVTSVAPTRTQKANVCDRKGMHRARSVR